MKLKKADIHPREADRLTALSSLNLLDTVSESEFDALALIASQICGTSIALISLVDQSRQWFKSRIGLEANETPREISFCAHAILQDDIFLVPDATLDDRFANNPLVTDGPKIRFYGGAPVRDPISHLPIGTLCVIDQVPKVLNPSQILALQALSTQITKLLELRIKIADLEKLNQNLIFLKTTFDNIAEGVVLQDSQGAIVKHNPAALRVLGVSADQLIGRTSMDPQWRAVRENGSAFPGEDHPAMLALKCGMIQSNVIMGIQTKLKETRWISITATPLIVPPEPRPSHVVTTFIDVSEQRRTQRGLLHAAKMTSLGEMAGGIAHEINTPLGVILGTAEHLKTVVAKNGREDKETAKLLIARIESTTERIAKIITGLRAFSRNAEADPKLPVDLHELVDQVLNLCREKLKDHGVSVRVDNASTVLLECREVQISQIILNLVINAFHAVRILEEKWIHISVAIIEDFVQISVTDSGRGLAPDVADKIMQPFFTTKDVGEGTGLGLSIALGLTKSHGGKLYYDDQSPHTRFCIELPLKQSNSLR